MNRINRSRVPAVRWIMVSVVAAVLVAVPVVAQLQFSDVPADNPHLDNINYVASQKWFVGYRDGTYKPDQEISPSEMTRVLWRAFDEGLTRAEFASFLVAGNSQRLRPSRESPLGYYEWGEEHKDGMFLVAYNLPYWRWNDDNSSYAYRSQWYTEPGRYRIPSGCRWMRLGHIPDGGQYFDTIAATDAPLAGYIQLEKTTEPFVIEIEITDFAFMIDC